VENGEVSEPSPLFGAEGFTWSIAARAREKAVRQLQKVRRTFVISKRGLVRRLPRKGQTREKGREIIWI
jgi:hypothetical protein